MKRKKIKPESLEDFLVLDFDDPKSIEESRKKMINIFKYDRICHLKEIDKSILLSCYYLITFDLKYILALKKRIIYLKFAKYVNNTKKSRILGSSISMMYNSFDYIVATLGLIDLMYDYLKDKK